MKECRVWRRMESRETHFVGADEQHAATRWVMLRFMIDKDATRELHTFWMLLVDVLTSLSFADGPCTVSMVGVGHDQNSYRRLHSRWTVDHEIWTFACGFQYIC